MRRALIVMNHVLSDEQIADLRENWGATEILYLPKHLKDLISQIPPDLGELKTYIKPLLDYINEILKPGDLLIIAGEPGATFLIVNYALSKKYIPIYATTRREIIEEKLDNGKVHITRTFKHVRFRKYGV